MEELVQDPSKPPISFLRSFLPLATSLTSAHAAYLLSDGFHDPNAPLTVRIEHSLIYGKALDAYISVLVFLDRWGEDLAPPGALPTGLLRRLMEPLVHAMKGITLPTGPLSRMVVALKSEPTEWTSSLEGFFNNAFAQFASITHITLNFMIRMEESCGLHRRNNEFQTIIERLRDPLAGVPLALTRMFIDASKAKLPRLTPTPFYVFYALLYAHDQLFEEAFSIDCWDQGVGAELTALLLDCLPDLQDDTANNLWRRYYTIGRLMRGASTEEMSWPCKPPSQRTGAGGVAGPAAEDTYARAAVYLRKRTKKRPLAPERPLERALAVTFQALRAHARLCSTAPAAQLDCVVTDMKTLAMLMDELVASFEKSADSELSAISDVQHEAFYAAGSALCIYFDNVSLLLRKFSFDTAENAFKLMCFARLVGIMEWMMTRLLPPPELAWANALRRNDVHQQRMEFLGTVAFTRYFEMEALTTAVRDALAGTAATPVAGDAWFKEASEAVHAICRAFNAQTQWVHAIIAGRSALDLRSATRSISLRSSGMGALVQVAGDIMGYMEDGITAVDDPKFKDNMSKLWALTQVYTVAMDDLKVVEAAGTEAARSPEAPELIP